MVNPNIFRPRNDWNIIVLKSVKYNLSGNTSLASILLEVSRKSKITLERLLSGSREREIVEARQIYFKRARETTNISYRLIGALVGLDHATVLHGVRNVDNVKELSIRYNLYFNPNHDVKKIFNTSNNIKPSILKDKRIINKLTEQLISPFVNMEPMNEMPYHGYREHSL